MSEWFRDELGRRPGWMNAIMLFSAFMALVYCPWDILWKPVAVDEEVWFGVLFHGWWAKLLALPHWIVYAGMAYGFWRMRSWMFPWAALYWGQVAVGMLVWPFLYRNEFAAQLGGGVAFALFGAIAVALWQARPLFGRERESFRARYGEWAVVTGASSGIGAAFARALARDGLSLVLTARRGDRLRALASELEKDHAIQTRVVEVDLATTDGADRLADEIADLPVGLLVNNAGFGLAGRFSKLDAERMADMVLLNCVAPVVLTHRLLPGMVERGCGAVVFTGSVAGKQPLPLHAVYGATKAFDTHLALSLWGEVREQGIDVLVLEPATTNTDFHDLAGELPHQGKSAEEVVETALDALGCQPAIVPGWWYWLRSSVAQRLLPPPIAALATKSVVEKHTPDHLR